MAWSREKCRELKLNAGLCVSIKNECGFFILAHSARRQRISFSHLEGVRVPAFVPVINDERGASVLRHTAGNVLHVPEALVSTLNTHITKKPRNKNVDQ